MARIHKTHIYMYIFMLSFVAALLAGCTSESGNTTIADDLSGFKLPDSYTAQVFEVTTPDSTDGYTMQTFEITTGESADLFEIWKDNQAKEEGQDKYDTIRSIYDDTSVEDEEAELEEYCESLFSNSCLEMETIKDHNGCRKVDVECKKYNGDDICIRYDINIKDDYVDDGYCE